MESLSEAHENTMGLGVIKERFPSLGDDSCRLIEAAVLYIKGKAEEADQLVSSVEQPEEKFAQTLALLFKAIFGPKMRNPGEPIEEMIKSLGISYDGKFDSRVFPVVSQETPEKSMAIRFYNTIRNVFSGDKEMREVEEVEPRIKPCNVYSVLDNLEEIRSYTKKSREEFEHQAEVQKKVDTRLVRKLSRKIAEIRKAIDDLGEEQNLRTLLENILFFASEKKKNGNENAGPDSYEEVLKMVEIAKHLIKFQELLSSFLKEKDSDSDKFREVIKQLEVGLLRLRKTEYYKPLLNLVNKAKVALNLEKSLDLSDVPGDQVEQIEVGFKIARHVILTNLNNLLSGYISSTVAKAKATILKHLKYELDLSLFHLLNIGSQHSTFTLKNILKKLSKTPGFENLSFSDLSQGNKKDEMIRLIKDEYEALLGVMDLLIDIAKQEARENLA